MGNEVYFLNADNHLLTLCEVTLRLHKYDTRKLSALKHQTSKTK